jgi:hypothetical protein
VKLPPPGRAACEGDRLNRTCPGARRGDMSRCQAWGHRP